VEQAAQGNEAGHHRILPEDPEMFEPSRASWNRMQKRLNKLSVSGKGYVIKADVANCFASVNQHALMDLESVSYLWQLADA
jgi:hypothetical protein